jgi:hypothetical protein
MVLSGTMIDALVCNVRLAGMVKVAIFVLRNLRSVGLSVLETVNGLSLTTRLSALRAESMPIPNDETSNDDT